MTATDHSALNDFRRRRFGDDGRVVAFVCEAAAVRCARSVLLTGEQFDSARAEGRAVVCAEHLAENVPSASPSINA